MCLFVVLCNTEFEKMLCRYGEEENCLDLEPETEVTSVRARSEPGGTRRRRGWEVKGKLANGVSSLYSHATSEHGLSSITEADAHTSAASSRLT